jgi:type VI secretion system secreted protein VgrG
MKSRAVRLLALSFLLVPLLALGAYANSICIICSGNPGSYAVLAGSSVTNTGTSTLNGNLGIYPGTALTGAGLTVSGATNLGNTAAMDAQNALTTAYNTAAGLSYTLNLSGTDLDTYTKASPLAPGVYFFSSSAQLSGALYLEGAAGALYVFQIGKTLTTGSGASVIFIDKATGLPSTDPNIFWQVGSSATLGTSTAFEGNILALSSITLDTSASIGCGSALAQTGAVTLDDNVIEGGCSGGGTSTVPEPGTLGLLGTGLALLAGAARRKIRI